MNFVWLGIFVFASVGIARAEIIEKLALDPWPWFGAGLLAFALARGSDRVERAARGPLIGWIAVLALALWAWGPLDAYAVTLLLAAAASRFLLAGRSFLTFLPATLTTAGMVALAQSAFLGAFRSLGADVHGFPWAASLFVAPLEALGLRTGVFDGTLYIQHSDGLQWFAPGFDQTGGLFALVLLVGAMPVLWIHATRPWKELLRVSLIVLAYAYLRYLVLIVSFHMHANPTYLWKVVPQTVTWLPCVLLLARYVQLGRPAASFEVFPRSGEPGPVALRTSAAGAVLGLAGVLALHFHDPGTMNGGRVLFDEYHSDWEWTDRPMGTEDYGLGTSYNYANLYEHLDRHYELERNWQPFTEEVLREHDVLVLRTPTRDYGPSELEAVREFVARGGGLWMIGDHTDVFGSSRRINPMAQQFGMRFRHDAEYDLETGSLNLFEIPAHNPHPVVSRMPNFLCATGCTIETSRECTPVMNVRAVNSLPADYSQRSFFPREVKRQDFSFGLYTMCAAREYGSGRVLAFSDSTVFSNFFMYVPGKPEFALGSIDWLNRSARFAWVRRAAAPAFLLAAVACLALLARTPVRRSGPQLVLGALAGSALASLACAAVVRAGYEEVEQLEPAERIHFDMENSSMFLPIARLQGEGDNDYATFMTWCQRVDLVPTVHEELGQALDHPEPGIVLMADLHRPPAPEDMERLQAAVAGGATLLVSQGPFGHAAAANVVLERFGMELGERYPLAPEPTAEVAAMGPVAPHDHDHAHDHAGEVAGTQDSGEPEAPRVALASPFARVSCESLWPVIGGEVLVQDESGEPVVAWKAHGSGLVVAVGCGELFTSERMGTVSVQPDPEHREIYELLYSILRLGSRRAEPPLANLLGQDFLAARER